MFACAYTYALAVHILFLWVYEVLRRAVNLMKCSCNMCAEGERNAQPCDL